MKIFTKTLGLTLALFLLILSGFRYQLENINIIATIGALILIGTVSAIGAATIIRDRHLINQAYYFYLLTVITSVIHAIYIPAALREIYLMLLAWLIFLCIYLLIMNGIKLKNIENSVLIVGSFFLAVKTYQIIKNIVYRYDSCQPFLNVPNVTAAFTTLLILLGLAAFITREGRGRILPAVVTGVGSVVLFFTLSRAGIISCITAVIFLLYLNRKKENINLNINQIILIAGVLITAAAIAITVGRPAQCINLITGEVRVSSNWNGNINSRLDIYRTALLFIIRRPLFGYGPGSFPIITEPILKKTKLYIHSHNLFLQLLFERGLIGLLGLAAVILLLVKTYFKSTRPEAVTGLAAILSISIHGLADHPLYEPLTGRLLMFILALALAAARKEKLNDTDL